MNMIEPDADRAGLYDFYVQHVNEQLLPFWKKALDFTHGGVYTGFDPLGQKLLHRDKFTWSQGRFLWLWSRLADMCRRGLLQDDENSYLKHADTTYQFLKSNAFLSNGNCIFLLTEEGEPKEMLPGEGHDISFYADCFVVMGFAEYARVAGNPDALQTAEILYANIEERLSAGTVRSEPYPIPEGYEAHGFAMIMLNTSQVIAKAEEEFGHQSAASYSVKAWSYAERILEVFCDEYYRVHEVVGKSAIADESALLLRHLNPGHTIESMWFVMEEAARHDKAAAWKKAAKVLSKALQMGWDSEYGGILRYVDVEGGQPKGTELAGADRFDRFIRDTWDMKLWWPHSEALYACLLAYELTGDRSFMDWHQRLHAYSFDTFPASEGEEWNQIRNREGKPVEQVVALPVKDPYHILRNLLLIIELEAPKQGTHNMKVEA